MSTGEDAMFDLIDAVALGIASDEEETLLRSLAAGDESIASLVRADHAVAARLATEIDQVTPPRRLRGAVMAEVHEDARVRASSGDHGYAPASSGEGLLARLGFAGGVGRLGTVAAGLAAAIVLVIGGIAVLQPGLNDPPAADITFEGTTAAPDVRGEALLRDDGSAVIRLRDLPPAGSGQGYQLWRLQGQGVESAGFLTVTGAGTAEALVTGVDSLDGLAVSVEDLDNREAPTTAPIAAVTIPEDDVTP